MHTSAGADVEVERELSAERLKALVDGGDQEARRLLVELLRSYGSPMPVEEAEEELKELVRRELRRSGLPEEGWLVDALYRILVAAAHAMLMP